MTNYNNLKCAWCGIIIGDSATPQHEKKVIDHETDRWRKNWGCQFCGKNIGSTTWLN
jgi:hypothetical protein